MIQRRKHAQTVLAGLITGLLFGLLASPLSAHPHIFIENSVQVVFDEHGMTGIHMRWVFDEMFSSALLAEFVREKNTPLTAEDVAALKAGAFDNLKEYHYFTSFTVDGTISTPDRVENFKADLHDNKIYYSFFIPHALTAEPAPRTVAVAMYDPTYFTDLLITSYTCRHLDEPAGIDCSVRPVQNTGRKFYFNQNTPLELIVSFQKKEE